MFQVVILETAFTENTIISRLSMVMIFNSERFGKGQRLCALWTKFPRHLAEGIDFLSAFILRKIVIS